MAAAAAAPAVSVVIGAYNGAAVIGETLASLGAQRFTDFEIIVVDDASTDDTLAVAAACPDPRLRIIRSEVNRGVVVTRNLGVAAARGRYLAALDQDDLCHPDRFARQVAWLDANRATVLLGTAATVLCGDRLAPSAHAPLSNPDLIAWLILIENPLVWSSVMLRTDAVRQLGCFNDPDLLYAEDFDLYHRISALGAIARLDEPLVTYRRHPGGASQRHVAAMATNATRVLARVYAGSFGDEAGAIASLIVKHLMRRQPVADRMTLRLIGAALLRLQDDFIARRAPGIDSLTLIRWETARRWARVTRTGLRAGAIGLLDAAAVRPDHLGLGYAGVEQLVLSRLVGGVRAVGRGVASRARAPIE